MSNSSILRVFENRNQVWDIGTQDWVAMLQPVINAGAVTVTGDINLIKLGGSTISKDAGTTDPGTLRVTVASNNPTLPTESIAVRALLVDYAAGTLPIYLGSAIPATATSAAAWQIRKLAYDVANNLISTGFADGVNTFTKVWDNRATYTYS